jgi:hypothetical protein
MLEGTSVQTVSIRRLQPASFILTKENERNEENSHSNIVLNAFHVEVRRKSLDLRIADVGLVDVGHEVKEYQHGNQMPLWKRLLATKIFKPCR